MKESISVYTNRLRHYVDFDIQYIKDVKTQRDIPSAKKEEGTAILKVILPNDHVVLLDEKGKEYISAEFAVLLQKKMNVIPTRIIFVVGGAYGFSQEVIARADDMLSLSRLTFAHDLVRLIFTEQLYRAFTILRGEKYHHD